MERPVSQEEGRAGKETTPEQFKKIAEGMSSLDMRMRETVGNAGGSQDEDKLVRLTRTWMQLRDLSEEADMLLEKKELDQTRAREIEEQYTLLRKAVQELLPELFTLKPSQSKMVH